MSCAIDAIKETRAVLLPISLEPPTSSKMTFGWHPSIEVELPRRGQGALGRVMLRLHEIVLDLDPVFSAWIRLDSRRDDKAAIVSIRNIGWGPAIDWHFRLENAAVCAVFPVGSWSTVATVEAGMSVGLTLRMADADQQRLAELLGAAAEPQLPAFDRSRDQRWARFRDQQERDTGRQARSVNEVRWRNHLKMTGLGHDWPYDPVPIPLFDEAAAIAAFEAADVKKRRAVADGIVLTPITVVAEATGQTERRFDVSNDPRSALRLTRDGFVAPLSFGGGGIADVLKHPLIDVERGPGEILIPTVKETVVGENRCFSIELTASQSCQISFDLAFHFDSGAVETTGCFTRHLHATRDEYSEDWRTARAFVALLDRIDRGGAWTRVV